LTGEIVCPELFAQRPFVRVLQFENAQGPAMAAQNAPVVRRATARVTSCTKKAANIMRPQRKRNVAPTPPRLNRRLPVFFQMA